METSNFAVIDLTEGGGRNCHKRYISLEDGAVDLTEDNDEVLIVSASNRANKRQKSSMTIVDADDDTNYATQNMGKISAILNSDKEEDDEEEEEELPLQQEKRGCHFRKIPSKAIKDSIRKAQTQNIYLIQQKPYPKDSLQRDFIILGTTGNVYIVRIGKKPSCSCTENHNGTARNNCKHILFVFLRVCNLESNNPIIYQKALLTSEVQEVFTSQTNTLNVLANPNVTEKYLQILGEERSKKIKQAIQKKIEGDCPICYEEMKPTDNLVFCKFSCGNSVHLHCWNKWCDIRKQAAEELKCIYCRSRWEDLKTSHTKNGYINLGAYQERPMESQPFPAYFWLLPELLHLSGLTTRMPSWDEYDSDDSDDEDEYNF